MVCPPWPVRGLQKEPCGSGPASGALGWAFLSLCCPFYGRRACACALPPTEDLLQVWGQPPDPRRPPQNCCAASPLRSTARRFHPEFHIQTLPYLPIFGGWFWLTTRAEDGSYIIFPIRTESVWARDLAPSEEPLGTSRRAGTSGWRLQPSGSPQYAAHLTSPLML